MENEEVTDIVFSSFLTAMCTSVFQRTCARHLDKRLLLIADTRVVTTKRLGGLIGANVIALVVDVLVQVLQVILLVRHVAQCGNSDAC